MKRERGRERGKREGAGIFLDHMLRCPPISLSLSLPLPPPPLSLRVLIRKPLSLAYQHIANVADRVDCFCL
jgi:hypothetical protein